MSDVRVRFAPSPTGKIHIGNIRTALVNYLFANKNDGDFILRIEDTDQERSSDEFADIIEKEMDWLGLKWDEGVEVGGEFGPYYQMERLDIYQEYVEKLIEADLAYYCYCEPEELDEMREEQLANDQPPIYDQRCRELTKEEREKLEAEGKNPAVRFRVPRNDDTIVVDDLIKGKVSFEREVIDDFVIMKSDGIPTYNFAVVIDDYLMEISHVIRGEDHLSNTPKQKLIYQALDWETPNFAHLPMILGSDKSKLSKRSGEDYVFVGEYRTKGYLPEALFNFLALLGWSPKNDQEIFSQEELVKEFSIENVNKSSAVFDVDKLNWMNGLYIREAELDRIIDLALPYLEAAEYNLSNKSQEWIELLVDTVRDSLDYVAQITEEVDIFFGDLEYNNKKEAIEEFSQEQVDLVLETLKENITGLNSFEPQNIRQMLKDTMNELPVGGRLFFHPTRVALTGKTSGPELYSVIALLGKEKSVNRLEQALDLIEA